MYTESTLSVEDETAISIYDLAAGTALSEVDTDALAHPYNPTVAKPIHLLKVVESEDGTFYSQIIGDSGATTPSVWCLYGRDGVDTSDWNVTDLMVDEAECSSTTTVLAICFVAEGRTDWAPESVEVHQSSSPKQQWTHNALFGGVVPRAVFPERWPRELVIPEIENRHQIDHSKEVGTHSISDHNGTAVDWQRMSASGMEKE